MKTLFNKIKNFFINIKSSNKNNKKKFQYKELPEGVVCAAYIFIADLIAIILVIAAFIIWIL